MGEKVGNKYFTGLLTAILIVQALILLQPLLKEKNAFAQTNPAGRYQIASGNVGYAFLLDTASGAVWFIKGKQWAGPEEFNVKKIDTKENK